MVETVSWDECGVVLVQSFADERVWSPVLEAMDLANTLAGALNAAKRYAIQEARQHGHIGRETIAADLRWRRGDSAAGKSALVLEVRSRG